MVVPLNPATKVLQWNASYSRRINHTHARLIGLLDGSEHLIQKTMKSIRNPIERAGNRVDGFVVKHTARFESRLKRIVDHKPLKHYLGGK